MQLEKICAQYNVPKALKKLDNSAFLFAIVQNFCHTIFSRKYNHSTWEFAMYLGYLVDVPDEKGKITFRQKGNAKYVYYEYDRVYDPKRKYTIVKRSTIGKLSDENLVRNIVYIGDSDTDIPCMKLVNVNGGHSIGVYNSETKDKSKVFRMLEENRIKYFEPADYSEGSSLEELLKTIIVRTKANEELEQVHYTCLKVEAEETHGQDEETKEKEILIDRLEASASFKNTHIIIKELQRVYNWTESEKEKLLKIALENNQVQLILSDEDVQKFFQKICNGNSENVRKVLEKIDKRS